MAITYAAAANGFFKDRLEFPRSPSNALEGSIATVVVELPRLLLCFGCDCSSILRILRTASSSSGC